MEKYVLTGVNAVQYASVLLQVDEVFRWIQLGLAIVCSIVLLAYRVWKWYKDANVDGKITADEVKQLIDENKDTVVDIAEKAVDLVDDIKENSKKE